MKTTPWLEHFKALLAQAGLRYMDAHTVLSDSEEPRCHETSHEWWKDDRNISVFERKIPDCDDVIGELVKVWGPNIHTEMERVALNDEAELIAAWKWLLGV